MATYTGDDGFTIDYVEHVPGSPEPSFEPERTSATRVLDVDLDGTWTPAVKFARSLLGYPKSKATFSGINYIQRCTPDEYPEPLLLTGSDGGVSLRAVKVAMRGIGTPSYADCDTNGTNRIAVYPKARLTVQYGTLPFDVWSERTNGWESWNGGVRDESLLTRYVSKVVEPGGQYLTLPGDCFKFVAYDGGDVPPVGLGGRPVMQGTGRMLIHFNMQLTWHMVPESMVPCALVRPFPLVADGPQAIDNALGKVNDATFAGYPAGTLLLTGVRFRPYRSALGKRIYDITYQIKFFKPETGKGHNHIFKQFGGEGRWYETTTDGTTNLIVQTAGRSIYDWYNFKTLFRPV